MHKIDTPDATRDGRFTEGDPTVPVPATTVSADWLNAVQDEVLAVLSAAGLTPAKNNNAQLLAALKKIVGTVNALTATANFDLWPEFSRLILLLLMFIGARRTSTITRRAPQPQARRRRRLPLPGSSCKPVPPCA